MLVVDDLAPSRHTLATKLRLFSFEPVAAGSVDEALERLASGEHFDCIVSDELMPLKGSSNCSRQCGRIRAARGCPS